MPMPPDSLLWWRAGTVSATTFLVGAVGHVSAGGLLPSWFALGAMFAVGTAISAVVLARSASTSRILLLVMAGQAVCHGLLSLSAGHSGDVDVWRAAQSGALPVSVGGRVGSVHDHFVAMTDAPSATSALTPPDLAAVVDHLPMFVAHMVAALLIGLWLAAGERSLYSLLALVVAGVVALLVVPAAAPLLVRRRAPLRRRPATLPCLARVSRCVVRRGPPALLAA